MSNEIDIEGVVIKKIKYFEDIRGDFQKLDDLIIKNEKLLVDELYISTSHKGVLRGMHLQVAPYEQSKLICVLQGSILDVVLDLRKGSKTYGKTMCFELNKDGEAVYIPKGCAHGFIAKEDNSMLLYAVNGIYNKESERGIRWDSIGVDWHVEEKSLLITKKDANFPSLVEWIKGENEIDTKM